MEDQMRAYFQRQFPKKPDDEKPSRFKDVANNAVRSRFLIALSGGIDSTVVTYLAVRAVGINSVLPITMPARPDDFDCLRFSALVRKQLGVQTNEKEYTSDEEHLPFVIDIEPILKTHMAVMKESPVKQIHLGTSYLDQSIEQKFRSGNFGSRIRIAILYDLQRAIRGRILGTCNRTEFCQGYNAKFGTPISYDFGVLNDMYKLDIYALAEALGVPQEIIDAAPSTGYFAGQTHEGELGATTEEQDIFCYLLFEKHLDPKTIAMTYGANEEFAWVIKNRFEMCDHKRCLNQNQEHACTFRNNLPFHF